jgi:hypothetical protein
MTLKAMNEDNTAYIVLEENQQAIEISAIDD